MTHDASEKATSQVFSHGLSRSYYEDCHEKILPFVFNREAKFTVNVSPASALPFASQLFSRGRDLDDSLEVCFRNFLTEAAELLIFDQIAVFEICEVPEDNIEAGQIFTEERAFIGTEKSGLKTLIYILPNSLEILDEKVIQHVSQTEFRDAQTISLPREKVFIIELPTWIEDGAGFHFIGANLIRESTRDSAPIALFENAKKKPNYFDYAAFKKRQDIRILRLTKASGWPGRAPFSERMTEYYLVNRYLRFARSNVRFRDYLIDKINDELLPVLRKQGVDFQSIRVAGLPTLQDLEKIQADLDRGDIGFKEALSRAHVLGLG